MRGCRPAAMASPGGCSSCDRRRPPLGTPAVRGDMSQPPATSRLRRAGHPPAAPGSSSEREPGLSPPAPAPAPPLSPSAPGAGPSSSGHVLSRPDPGEGSHTVEPRGSRTFPRSQRSATDPHAQPPGERESYDLSTGPCRPRTSSFCRRRRQRSPRQTISAAAGRPPWTTAVGNTPCSGGVDAEHPADPDPVCIEGACARTAYGLAHLPWTSIRRLRHRMPPTAR